MRTSHHSAIFFGSFQWHHCRRRTLNRVTNIVQFPFAPFPLEVSFSEESAGESDPGLSNPLLPNSRSIASHIPMYVHGLVAVKYMESGHIRASSIHSGQIKEMQFSYVWNRSLYFRHINKFRRPNFHFECVVRANYCLNSIRNSQIDHFRSILEGFTSNSNRIRSYSTAVRGLCTHTDARRLCCIVVCAWHIHRLHFLIFLSRINFNLRNLAVVAELCINVDDSEWGRANCYRVRCATFVWWKLIIVVSKYHSFDHRAHTSTNRHTSIYALFAFTHAHTHAHMRRFDYYWGQIGTRWLCTYEFVTSWLDFFPK